MAFSPGTFLVLYFNEAVFPRYLFSPWFEASITVSLKIVNCSPDNGRPRLCVTGMSLVAFLVILFWPLFPDGEGSGSKRPKVELSKEELKAHATKGTLGKLTVPMLKEACRVCGLKGGLKKQELLDMLTQHFLKD